MTNPLRMPPKLRKPQLLNCALELARRQGLSGLTREAIADFAGTSPALVSHYLGTMINLKRDVMRAAVKREVLEVIAEGLAERPINRFAQAAPLELKRRALDSLTRV